MHNAYEVRDAQYALGQLADDGADRPAEDRRDRRLLRRRHVDRARRAAQPHAAARRHASCPGRARSASRCSIAATVPGVHVVGPRDRAEPERLARSTTSPTRRTSAAATASASRSRPGTATLYGAGTLLGYYAPDRAPIPSADITGWKALTDTGGPFDGNPAATAMVAELTANHSALLHRRLDPARARRCWPTAGTTTCSRSTSRCATTTRSARSTRTRRSRCSTSTSATARAPAPISAADRAALDGRRERVAGLLRQGRRLRARRRARRRRHPHLQVPGQRRRHALPRADLGAARARRGARGRRRGADDRRARHRAVERVHLRRRVHDHGERRQRVGRDLQDRAGDGAYTLAGSPTVVAKLDRHGRQRHGRRAPVRRRRRDAAADRARRAAPARRRRRPDRAGLPAASAGLDRRSPATCSSSSCSRRTRTYLRTPTGQQSVGVSDLQLRLPVVDAPGTDLGGVTVSAPAAKYVPAGYKLAREYATDASGGAGGSVPATLALTLGAPATLRRVHAGRGARVHGVHDGDRDLDGR